MDRHLDSAEHGDHGLAKNRIAILDAAAETFIARGYVNTSMEAIAKRAAVSKQTVYNHFPSKEDLFSAIVRTECDQFLEPLIAVETADRPTRDVLMDIGAIIINVLLVPRSIGLYRVLIAEAPHFGELGKVFYKAGPQFTIERLAGYLASEAAKGRLKIDDAEVAAHHYFGMVANHIEHLCLLGIQTFLPKPELDRWLTMGVDAFLRAYAPVEP